MKVLRVIARLNVGGPARHVVLLDSGLRERGYETLLVHGSVGSGEASLEHLAAERGLPVSKLPELGPRIAALDDLRALIKLVRLTLREQPDIIHTHTAKAGTLGRVAAFLYNTTRPRARRALVVHTFHGNVLSGYFGSTTSALVRGAERTLAAITDCIVTLSPLQREEIVTRFRVAPADRVAVVPLGLDLDRLLALPPLDKRSRAQAHDGVVIGFVGRFVPIKNLPLLVSAFAGCARDVPGVTLVLAGDGPSRPDVERAVREAGIADRVRFAGWTEDLTTIYATMDVCALSSTNEGTPVALIEAMAAGRAVVATAVGGVPDLVDPEVNGLLVPSNDREALTQALVRLARSPEDRVRFGAAAREAVARRFSPDRLANDIDELYRTGLSGRRK